MPHGAKAAGMERPVSRCELDGPGMKGMLAPSGRLGVEMMSHWFDRSWLAACALAALLAAVPAQAQDTVAQFYRGKQINLYIGSTPGGGYDAYARLLARK